MTKRDIGMEILEGLREIKQGGGRRFAAEGLTDIRDIREKMSLSQSAFAALLGVSLRTLQDWEQGRRQPTGAARSLILVAQARPEVLLAVLLKKAA
ncbi:MAG TPA: helix-turn-helix domain-containing protein [Candidatus Ozemobacteraceae bacterium]|nr:helix-turn-helix domain-containing protein [Candidatus Ozemobacteraceae bacterium]HQG27101.1 helix-turn-helix domain-containing protein [Candidatus Ozemobacteraceae bacterium]